MSAGFVPKFTITEKILNAVARITASVTIINQAPLIPKWEVSLRREALIRSAHASTAIEGNPLTLEEVSELAAGREVMAQRKAKTEVLNYLNVLGKVPDYARESFSDRLILTLHKALVKGVLDDPSHIGKYRKIQVVVGNRVTGKITFRPPPASEVSELMSAFLEWLKQSVVERNPVLEAGIAHYEFVRIHPFVDGNGRMARTLASLILYKRGFDTKRFFALDDFYDHDRKSYYAALQTVDSVRRDLTQWLEYFAGGVMLQVETVRKKILELSTDARKIRERGQVALNEKQMRIVEFLHKCGKVTNQDLQKLFSVSDKTSGGYLADLVKIKVLSRKGKGRSVYYVLK